MIGNLERRISALQDQLDACVNAPTSNLAIARIEWTQAIQTFNFNGQGSGFPDNGVRMVARKETILRVYVDTTASPAFPTPASVSGKVYEDPDQPPLRPINGRIPAVPSTSIDRGNSNHTLNFRIPAEHSTTIRTFTVWVFDPAHEGDNAYTAKPAQVTLGFDPVPEVRIHGVLIHYTGRGLDIPAPSGLDLFDTLEWVARVLPIPGFTYTAYDMIDFNGDLTHGGGGGCGVGWNELFSILQNMRNASKTKDVYVGLLPLGVPTSGVIGCGGGGVAIAYVGEGRVLSQEIGHAFGRAHAPCGNPPFPDPNYPVYNSYPLGSIGEFGFDSSNSQIFNPAFTYDYMSYCGGLWTSPYTYNGVKSAISTSQAALHPERAGGRDVRDVDREHLYLNFRVHTAHDGKVDLLPSYMLHGPGLVLEGVPEAPVWCQLVGADGEVILVHRCHLSNPHHDPDAATFDVHEAVPWDPAAKSLEFLRGGKVIDRIEVEADDPKLTVKPPRRAGRGPELMRVEWDAQHSKKFWCIVRYTHDGGETWRAVAADLTSWSLAVNLDLLPGGERCMFQIVASSGLRTVAAETEPFEVRRKPRTAAILRPKPDERFPRSESVVLLAAGIRRILRQRISRTWCGHQI